jgi:sRNA-binding protein
MEVWRIVLYAGASLLALRSLAGLMTQHKQAFTDQQLALEEQKLRAERARAKKAKALQAAAAKKKPTGPKAA